MSILDIIQSNYIAAISGAIGGVVTAWLTQRVLNRRGTFVYFVNHLRVGVSAEDIIFGTVSVTWNGQPVSNLFLSSLELKNESMNDYENVIVQIYTNNTLLLSEQTQILNMPNILEWSERYKNQVYVKPGESPTDSQRSIFYGQREYVIPVFNRGQSIRITYLNSAKENESPSIWLSCLQKGVKVKFRVPQNEIFGVPQPRAALAGIIIGIGAVTAIVLSGQTIWFAATGSFIIGLIAQVPGAYAIKFIRKVRDAIGG